MLAKILVAGALAAVAVAQDVSKVLFFTRVPNPVTAGQPQAITFSTNDSSIPVTILLRKGVSGDLKTVATLTKSASDGQYVWTPEKDLPNGSDYALEIEQASQFNYYGPFTLQGGGQASSSSSSASVTSSSQSGSTATIISPTRNVTSAHPPFATGNVTHHNTTLSSATKTKSANLTPTTSAASSTTSSDDAGFQTPSADAPQDTNAAATIATGSGAVTLLFGAIAAMLFC